MRYTTMFSTKNIGTPEQSLKNALLTLATLAESFRSIEVLFMTSHPEPKFLAHLCETILAKGSEQLKFPKAVIYPEYINIQYQYSADKKAWIKKREECTIAHDDISAIIQKFCQQLMALETHHARATRAYFARQRQFYQDVQEEKAEMHKERMLNTGSLTGLINILKPHDVLLCKSPEDAAQTIEKLLRKYKTLSEIFWQELVLSIFVGRDLLGQAKSDRFQDPIEELIIGIANHCVTQHKIIYPPQMSNLKIEVSDEELQIILKMRQANLGPG